MRRLVIDMQSFLFADAIAQALQKEDSDFDVQRVGNPKETFESCLAMQPYALLMEVTGYTPWQIAERLKLRNDIKKACPNCKMIFLCDENADRRIADSVRQAKKDGLIDAFIYGSISSTYLVALMDTL